MMQFEAKWGKFLFFLNFEKFTHQLLSFIPEIINTLLNKTESRIGKELSWISTVGQLASCQKSYSQLLSFQKEDNFHITFLVSHQPANPMVIGYMD